MNLKKRIRSRRREALMKCEDLTQIELRSGGDRQYFYTKMRNPPTPWKREFGGKMRVFEFVGIVDGVYIYEEVTW